jgi:hypothetical protein
MAVPIIQPVPQFCDADGQPYAGGTIETYIPGTSTPKAVWVDPDRLAYNTNPIVLDAAGRCLWYGDGEYRLVLRDAAGNLVWDALSTTIVSAAMEPVVEAPTIADAVNLLGIDDLIAAAVSTEATARYNADNTLFAAITAEQAARIAADALLAPLASPTFTGDPKAPTPAPGDNDTSLATTAYVMAAIAAALSGIGGAISGPVQTRTGTFTTDGGGIWTCTFSTPFPTECLTLQAHGAGAFPNLYYITLTDTGGFPSLPTTTGATGHGWALTGGSGADPVPAIDTAFVYTATGY